MDWLAFSYGSGFGLLVTVSAFLALGHYTYKTTTAGM